MPHRKIHPALVLLLSLSVAILASCGQDEPSSRRVSMADVSRPVDQVKVSRQPQKTPLVLARPVSTPSVQSPPLVEAARRQIGKTIYYDPSYVGLAYPGGDVPRDRGVCTDVVIRALRDAHQFDLQKLVHEDMKASFSRYPTIWNLKRPDRNIDHRRVPNLQTYFQRKGYSIDVTRKGNDYRPGDIVTCMVGNRPHIMLVSDRKTRDGVPLVIHNIGRGTREEDQLFAFQLKGHYRMTFDQEDQE